MSIEKLNFSSKSEIENIPFVQVSNHVVLNIKNNDAFRVWVFLLSKSMDWVVIKDWTEKQCGIGKGKGKQVWSYLQRCNLINAFPVKNEKGQIIKWDLKILNGSQFDADVPFKKPKDIKPITSDDENKIYPENHRYEKPSSGETTRMENNPLLKKEVTKEKEFFTKQTKKSFYDRKKINEKKHDFAPSMNQMANEAKHIQVHEEFKRTRMPENLRKLYKSFQVYL